MQHNKLEQLKREYNQLLEGHAFNSRTTREYINKLEQQIKELELSLNIGELSNDQKSR